MADNSRDDGEQNGPQSIFDLFEPPPDPDPNTFGKVPVVRGEDDDFDRKAGTTAAERKTKAEAEAAGLQHWTEPATGQVPAVFGSDGDRPAWTDGKGPSWQSDDSSWSGPDLSDVFADHRSGDELPVDARPAAQPGSDPTSFDPGEGREIPTSRPATFDPEEGREVPSSRPASSHPEEGREVPMSQPASSRPEEGWEVPRSRPASSHPDEHRGGQMSRPASTGPDQGRGPSVARPSAGHDPTADRGLDRIDHGSEPTMPHSRFDASAPSRDWDLGSVAPVSDASPATQPDRSGSPAGAAGQRSSSSGNPVRSDFDLGADPAGSAPPQFSPAARRRDPKEASSLSVPDGLRGPQPTGGVLGASSASVAGRPGRFDDPARTVDSPPANRDQDFDGLGETARAPLADHDPAPVFAGSHQAGGRELGPDGDPVAQAGSGRPIIDDQAATAPGMYGFDDQPPEYHDDQPQPRESRGAGRNLGQAIGVGVGLALLAAAAMWLGPAYTMIVVVAAALLAVVELYNSMRLAGLRPAALLGILGTVAIPVVAYFRGDAAFTVVVALGVIFGALWYLAGADTERPVLNLSLTLLGVFWIGGLGGFAALILRSDAGIQLLLATIVITVVSDTLAYIGGRAYGSRPLHSASPSKTWEGTMTGVVGALFAGFALGVLPFETMWDGAFTQAILLGAVVGILVPIGDLTESMVKRDLGVKDMGTILPGHGGVLDRIDGLLFALPGAYYLALTSGLL